MRTAIGYFLTAVALTVLIGIIVGALTGCGPQDDHKTCSGTKHVQICTRDGGPR